jgi:hypothetical protein
MDRSSYIASVQHEGQLLYFLSLLLAHPNCDGPTKVVVKVLVGTVQQHKIEEASRLQLHTNFETLTVGAHSE